MSIPVLAPLKQRIKHVEDVLSSSSFLKMEGLNNEIPFFVFAHPSEQQFFVDQEVVDLIARLKKSGITIESMDLFDLTVEILKKQDLFDVLLDAETGVSKEEFKETLQNVTDPETEFVPAIAERLKGLEYDVIILTGAGLVYPFMRSHALLNNLQSLIKDRPVLLIFPGEYSFSDNHGQSLDLFGKLNEDKYYRAYNISNIQL